MEFQTKKQKKDHLRLVNNVAVQGPAKYTDWSRVPITFTEEDLQLESYPHTDAMVIKTNIAAWEISRVLIDTGSSADIIFVNTFDQMKLSKNQLQPSESPLNRIRRQADTSIRKNLTPSVVWNPSKC